MEIFGLRSPRTLFCEWTLRFEKQVHWRWHHYHAKDSSRQNFRDLRGKGFPTDSRHSNGHKLCPSPSRHISVLIRSGIHTVFAINLKEKVSISVQLHIQIHRWRIVNQYPRFWELSGSDLSRWALDERHDVEQHLCFLLGLLLLIRRDGQLRTSLYDKRDDFNFEITNFPFLSSNITSSLAYGVFISQLYGMPGLAPLMKQKRSTEGCSNFKGPETRQVQERLISTLEHMQVPKWDRTRCPEE